MKRGTPRNKKVYWDAVKTTPTIRKHGSGDIVQGVREYGRGNDKTEQSSTNKSSSR